MSTLGLIATAVPSAAIIVLCVWIFIKYGGRDSRRHAGTYAIMYALFFSFGRFFHGAPDYIEVAKDPEWKKRAENGDPPSK